MLALLLVLLITVLIMGGIAGFVLLVTNLPRRPARRGFGWIGGPSSSSWDAGDSGGGDSGGSSGCGGGSSGCGGGGGSS